MNFWLPRVFRIVFLWGFLFIVELSPVRAVPIDQSFTYDAANRLTSANITTYNLDRAGNLLGISGSVGPSLSLPATFNSASGAQTGMTIAVTSNLNWTAASNQSWLTITSGSSGNGNGTVIFSIGENTGGARSAEIRVTHVGSGLSAVCTVTQAGATPSLPDILVEQGGAVSNDGSRSFGSVAVGSSNTLTFTVRNTGQGTLSGLSISKSGANGPDYSVVALGNVTLPASGSTTFTVQFSPSGTGPRSATIDIASNDPDENPYRIHLSGTGTSTGGGGTPGTLDTSFGSGGKTTFYRSNEDYVSSMALQSDGKVVLGGSTWGTTNFNFAVVRRLGDGSVDSTFGTGGWVTTDFGGQNQGVGVVVQSDGRILLAGSTRDAGNTYSNFALARYETNGALDSTFGSSGKVTTSVGSGKAYGAAIALQTDGRILVAGSVVNGGAVDYGLVRYLANGTLDNSFGSGGKVVTQSGGSSGGVSAVAVNGNGKILVASGIGGQFGLVCYNSDGSLDLAFGNGGKVATSIRSNDSADSILLQADGKIVLVGIARDGWGGSSTSGVGLARYHANGTLDASFGNGGKAYTQLGIPGGVDCEAALQADGSIVVTSHLNGDVLLARFRPNGSLDSGFGPGGIVTTPIGVANDYGRCVAVQPDGQILVAGIAYPASSGPTQIALLRYHGGTSPQPEITIEQPAGTWIADGGGRNFGSVAVGDSTTLIFTIRNRGAGVLTGLAIAKSGANSSDFTLGIPGQSTLSTSDSTTFTVTFAPTDAGDRSALIQIAGNETTMNPFDITLTGTGTTPTVVKPTVTTNSPSSVTHNSAVVGGNVTNSGGSAVTERGIDFASWPWPVGYLVERRTSGSGAGSFNVNLSDLSPNTTYYYRAYAVNSAGLAYDETLKSFTTAASPSPTPARIYNQQLLSNLSGGQGTSSYYVIAVPEGQRTLRIESNGGTGDANLYVSFGRIAVRGASDYDSTRGASDELISIDSPAAGDYFILVHSLTSTAGVSLRASYLPPSPPALRIYGPRNIRTSRASVALRGAATDPDGDLARVKFRVSGPWRTASGLASWRANAVLKPGNNRIQVEAGDRTGRRSPIQQVRVFRR